MIAPYQVVLFACFLATDTVRRKILGRYCRNHKPVLIPFGLWLRRLGTARQHGIKHGDSSALLTSRLSKQSSKLVYCFPFGSANTSLQRKWAARTASWDAASPRPPCLWWIARVLAACASTNYMSCVRRRWNTTRTSTMTFRWWSYAVIASAILQTISGTMTRMEPVTILRTPATMFTVGVDLLESHATQWLTMYM